MLGIGTYSIGIVYLHAYRVGMVYWYTIDMNVIKVNSKLKAVIKGKPPKSHRKVIDGTLLVGVSNEQQTALIYKINALGSVDVEVELHVRLNQIKGKIRYRYQSRYIEKRFCRNWKSNEYQISSLITKKRYYCVGNFCLYSHIWCRHRPRWNNHRMDKMHGNIRTPSIIRFGGGWMICNFSNI